MSKRLIISLILCMIGSVSAQAQYTGVSAFAGLNPRFPCREYLQILNQSPAPAMAVLWDSSFGTDLACVTRFLHENAHKDHLIQIHLANNVCWRNRTCEAGDFWSGLDSKMVNYLLENQSQLFLQSIADRLGAIREYMAAHGTARTQTVLSLGLEDNFSPRAYEIISNFVRERWPWILVRNPEGSHRDLGVALFREEHGARARCRGRTAIASEDGSTQSASQSRRWLTRNTHCFVRFLWRPAHQGRQRSGRFKSGRFNREFEISKKDVEQLGRLLRDAR